MVSPTFHVKENQITGGGVNHAVFDLSKAVCKLGHEVTILTKARHLSSEFSSRLNFISEHDNFELKVLPSAISHQCEIIHTHYSSGLSYVLPSWISKRMKTVVHVHDRPRRHVKFYSLSRLVYLLSDRVITPSILNKQMLMQSHGLPSSKVEVLSNGVDTSNFYFMPSEAELVRSRLGLKGKRVILTVGHYPAPSKGIEFMLKGARTILSAFPEAVFVFIGQGPEDHVEIQYMNRVNRIISDLDLRQKVTFLDYVPHSRLAQYYSMADVFVQPSVIESFGMPMIEAMACERPVIATEVGGAPEVFRSNENGMLVAASNTESLSNAIVQILSNERLARKLGENARNSVVSNYDWSAIAKSLVRIYEEL